MNKKIVVVVSALVIAFVGFFAFKPENFEKKVEKLQNELESYQLVGSMDVNSSEDTKSYAITSSYKKSGDQEYFKVEMTDKNLNQTQIILKNEEGVFVITPSLNQVFKFQGEWPTNSAKPYLLQTMFDLLNLESTKVTKNDQGYLIESVANYPSATHLVSQKIQFSKDLKPMGLLGYTADNICELSLQFSNVEYHVPFADDFFTAPKSSINSVTTSYLEEAELPLYPMAVFDAKLTNVTVSSLNGAEEHVLEFSGEKTFTVTEKQIKPYEEFRLTEVQGELVEGLGVLAYYNGNKLTGISSQMETSVYSDDLTVMEMLQILDSMQVSVMK